MLSSDFLGDLGGNSVHVSDTLLGKRFTNDNTINLDGTNKTVGFEFLEAVSDDLTGGHGGMLGLGTVSLGGRVVLSELVDTDSRSHVGLVSNGGGSDVKPVIVVWSEILETGSLIVGNPLLKI